MGSAAGTTVGVLSLIVSHHHLEASHSRLLDTLRLGGLRRDGLGRLGSRNDNGCRNLFDNCSRLGSDNVRLVLNGSCGGVGSGSRSLRLDWGSLDDWGVFSQSNGGSFSLFGLLVRD
jgi:hypothetical protein